MTSRPAVRSRLLLALLLAGSLGAAAVAATLSIKGLHDLRAGIVAIKRTSAAATFARDVVDQVGQSLVSFTAIALDDLSPEERAGILSETDSYFTALERSIQEVEVSAADFLSSEQRETLAGSVRSIAHSWQEILDESATGMSAPEKTYHFLRILDDVRAARSILKGLETTAARRAESETRNAFARIGDNLTLVFYIIAAGAVTVLFAVLLVIHYTRRLNRSNEELAAANVELRKREREIGLGIEALERAKDAAEAANNTKSDFLAMVSHELRTPLNAIVGFSDMLVQGAHGALENPRHREYVGYIHSSGHHLSQLIDDILDYSKIEAGKLEIAEDVVDLVATVRSAATFLRPRCEEGGLSLDVDAPAALPLLRGDERRIKQILLNLLSNAVKFTPPEGTVTVSASCDDEGGLAVAVRDTGIGIAPEDMAKVLEPFGQVESALSRRYEGTGLGLPLVSAMMELHGGALHLQSAVGTGTVATVTFPPWRVVAEADAKLTA